MSELKLECRTVDEILDIVEKIDNGDEIYYKINGDSTRIKAPTTRMAIFYLMGKEGFEYFYKNPHGFEWKDIKDLWRKNAIIEFREAEGRITWCSKIDNIVYIQGYGQMNYMDFKMNAYKYSLDCGKTWGSIADYRKDSHAL